MRLSRLAAVSAAVLLASCATSPEPCTPEWVEWKTEKVLTNFSLAHYSEVNRLRRFADALQDDPGPLTLLQVPSMIEEFKSLASEFETDAWPALQAAASACGSVEALAPAFISYLEKEGVGEDVLEWVELLAAFAVQSEST